MASTARLRMPDLLLRLPERPWLLAAVAFALGLLLFVVVWLAVRDDGPAPDAPVRPTAAAPGFEPLPVPMSPGDAATSMSEPSDEPAQLVETAPPPEPAAPTEPSPVPELPAPVADSPAAATAVQAPALLPDQPQPRYPASALRAGETGTVVLKVDVDALGHPVGVEVVGRSGSRALDRAAVDAVSRWQFQAARDAGGQSVPGTLTIPIDFATR